MRKGDFRGLPQAHFGAPPFLVERPFNKPCRGVAGPNRIGLHATVAKPRASAWGRGRRGGTSGSDRRAGKEVGLKGGWRE
jgi:hypothetical protein